MKPVDLFAMAAHNLWQRRLRTALNVTGIVIGCTILLITAAGAGGVSDAVHALFDASEFARQIGVFPGGVTQADPPTGTLRVEGDMSQERRERLRQAMEDQWRISQPRSRWKISPEHLAELEQIPHVDYVVPEVLLRGTLQAADQKLAANLVSALPGSASLKDRIIAGHPLQENDRQGALIDEFLAYRLGYVSDKELGDLIGRQVTFQFRVRVAQPAPESSGLEDVWSGLLPAGSAKLQEFQQAFELISQQLDASSLSPQQRELVEQIAQHLSASQAASTEEEISRSFVVRGIVQRGKSQNMSDLFRQYFHNVRGGEIYVHYDLAADMYLSDSRHRDFPRALVSVDRTSYLDQVTEALKKRGARAQSSAWLLKNLDDQIARKAWIVYAIAAAVLLTSAIGISNTLVISVLERTPEFGILKSVGARDADLVLLMIIEGGILGAVGATIAIFGSRLVAWLGHALLKWYVESRLDSQIQTDLFQFTLLPAAIVMIVAVVICAAASILPAWRAARLDPITAMRRT